MIHYNTRSKYTANYTTCMYYSPTDKNLVNNLHNTLIYYKWHSCLLRRASSYYLISSTPQNRRNIWCRFSSLGMGMGIPNRYRWLVSTCRSDIRSSSLINYMICSYCYRVCKCSYLCSNPSYTASSCWAIFNKRDNCNHIEHISLDW